MKRLFPLFAALALSACTIPTLGTLSPVAAPAPLAATVVDDRALQTAWQSFDVALDGITLLRTSGVIKVGSAKAITVANGIDRVTAALTAAEHAAAAGSTTSYATALREASLAISELRVALRSK